MDSLWLRSRCRCCPTCRPARRASRKSTSGRGAPRTSSHRSRAGRLGPVLMGLVTRQIARGLDGAPPPRPSPRPCRPALPPRPLPPCLLPLARPSGPDPDSTSRRRRGALRAASGNREVEDIFQDMSLQAERSSSLLKLLLLSIVARERSSCRCSPTVTPLGDWRAVPRQSPTCLGRAAGNPKYIEWMLKALIDAKAISFELDDEGSHVSGDGRDALDLRRSQRGGGAEQHEGDAAAAVRLAGARAAGAAEGVPRPVVALPPPVSAPSSPHQPTRPHRCC